MSSYYYPYFSARDVWPSMIQHYQSSVSSLYRQRQLFEQQMASKKIRQKEQMLNSEVLKDYQLQLRMKRRLNDEKYNAQRDDLFVRKQQQKIISQMKNREHFKQMQETKTQRKQKQKLEKQNVSDNNNIKKDFQMQKFSEKTIKQYQNELLNKINQVKVDRKKVQSNRRDRNTNQKQESAYFGIIINKVNRETNENEIKRQNKNQQKRSRNFDKDKDALMKQLLSNYETSLHPLEASQRGKTIDCNNQTIDDRRKIKNKRSSRTKCHSQRRVKNKHKVSFIAKPQEYKTLSPRSLSLKRMQNRIKLSMIVFKDSKMRNDKYQIDHILNKFQNQNKLRQQIKYKINFNQKIINKYGLVYQTRTKV